MMGSQFDLVDNLSIATSILLRLSDVVIIVYA